LKNKQHALRGSEDGGPTKYAASEGSPAAMPTSTVTPTAPRRREWLRKS